MKIALITACLAGVAHSKMAALALKKEAKIRGHEICVEEQGGHKIPVKISKEQIEQADVVIIAKMVSISGKDRFKGKKIYVFIQTKQTKIGSFCRRQQNMSI